MQDLWLLRHDASVAGPLAESSRAWLREARSWQAVDGHLAYFYVPDRKSVV